MPGRERFEQLALYVALLALVAFAASFVLGLMRSDSPPGPLVPQEAAHTGVAGLPPVVHGRIEVLNGSGRAGLARQVTERLRGVGFDVVYFGNASARRDSSEVLDRTGRGTAARAAADQLGIARVRTVPDSTLLLDATVVLGRDWPRSEPAPAAAARRGWWARVKGWLSAD